jgi:regulatory protein
MWGVKVMKITSVERNPKKKGTLRIYLDGHFGFSILEEDFISMNLYEYKELTNDEINYIKNAMNFRRAKSQAVKYLSAKLRNEKEIKTKLENDGFDDNAISRAIGELKSLGYINDRLYVQKYIYDRSKLKPKSKRLIKLELAAKGINEEIINEELNDWKVDELAVAEGLIRKKFGKYDLNDEKILKRIYSFLKHRGFSHEISSNAIKGLNSR